MRSPVRGSLRALEACAVMACVLMPGMRAWGQGAAPIAQQRIVESIDDSQRVTLKGNTLPIAQVRFDQGPAPASMPAGRMILVLRRSAQQEADLQTYLQEVQNPASANFHKFLTPDAFGQRFGVGDADLAQVQSWLESHGLQVKKTAKSRMAIEITGSVGQVEAAFQTSVHRYMVSDQQFWANESDPQIPEALAPVVAGLASLNSIKPKPQVIRGPSGVYDAKTHTITPTYTTGNSTNGYYIFLGPADAATIYDTPTVLNPHLSGTALDGTGVTIGIAGDSNIDVTQNANYRATFGLPAKATTVVLDGTDPGQNSDEVEAYLDTQVAGGIAPNANVILYTAADTSFQSGLFLAIQRALDDNQADILNVSFGACEQALGAAGNQYVSSLWEQAAAQGIAVTVSSGDSGSAGCDDPNTENAATMGLAVNGIASTPYNIAVGGTDFDALYTGTFPASFLNYVDVTNTLPNHRSALSYIPEEPWNDSTLPNQSIAKNVPYSVTTGSSSDNNIVAGGGGLSTVYPAPVWQSGFASGTMRNVPDISFLAGNGFYGASWGICTNVDPAGADCAAGATGNNFNLSGVGGTSAAAPAFAGMLALVEQKVGSRLGQANDVLYQLAKTQYGTVFHDVTTGDNSVVCVSGTPNCALNPTYNFLTGYNATTGYDTASGLGSLDATKLANAWASVTRTATTSALLLNGANTPLSITHGQSVTVSTTVTGAGGAPTGEVGLVDTLSPATLPNAGAIATYALASGAASGTTVSLPGGTYQVSTHYSGDTTFAESDSNAISVSVAPESSTTSLKVAGYLNPLSGKAAAAPYYGSIFLLDAQPYGNSASASSPNGIATGTVTYKAGTATLGTASLTSSGTAELQTSLLPSGANSLTASFPGDASFQASTSAPVSLTVQPAPTAVQVTAGAGPFITGNPMTLTASFVDSAGKSVLDSAGVAPTGTITFMNGTTALGTATVSGTPGTSTALATGSASLTSSLIPCGNASITATYGGDANYAPSAQSSAANLTILCATTAMTVTPTPSTIKSNQPLAVNVSMPAFGTLPAPTGTVTLIFSALASLGGQVVYSSPAATVVNGAVTITIPANTLPPGTLYIAANYSGDSYYHSSTAPSSVVVDATGTTTPTMTLTLPTGPVSGPFPVGVTVSGPSGSPTPTGSVSISGISGLFPLTNGSASVLYTPAPPVGKDLISAQYYGDSTYTSANATGSVFVQAIPYFTFAPNSATTAANQALNLTVTIATVAGLPAPTGTITLTSGSFDSGPVTMVSGAASFTIPANTLAQGVDYVTANYSGDTNYASGTAQDPVTVTAPIPPGFTATGTAVTVTAGATTGNTSTVTVTPAGGFTGSVTLSAAITGSPTGAVNAPTLSFGSTSPVTISGTSAATATLTVTTTAASSGTCTASNEEQHHMPWYAPGGAVLACLFLFWAPEKRRRWRAMLGMTLLLVALAGGALACGGGGGNTTGCTTTSTQGTTAGTYTATITATSGSTTATGTVTIVVN